MDIFIHHHHRCQTTCSQTPHPFQGKPTIRCGAAFFEVILAMDAIEALLDSLDITGRTGARLDDVPPLGSQGKKR